jgi:hypothetical protein
MKQNMVLTFLTGISLFAVSTLCGQAKTIKSNSTDGPTPKNVLAWSKELSGDLEKISSKLEKIKTKEKKDEETRKTFLVAVQKIREILQKGDQLTPGDAVQYDKWFRNAIIEWSRNCPNGPDGSECCFSCGNGHHPGGGSGWNASWCFANCFVFRFPGL